MLRILIVEDEAMVAAGLEMVLEDAGFEVVGWAMDGAEALALAEAHRPDLALVDIQLRRGDDGVEVARVLREGLKTQIIFLTAQADPRTKLRAAAVSHLAYMLKPFVTADLLAMLGSLERSFESQT